MSVKNIVGTGSSHLHSDLIDSFLYHNLVLFFMFNKNNILSLMSEDQFLICDIFCIWLMK